MFFLRNKIKQIYNGRIDLKTKFVAFRKYAFKWEGCEEKMSHDLIFLKINEYVDLITFSHECSSA